jgi:purine-cytosine permease-like protein
MSEIYWITRLTSLSEFFVVISILSTLAIAVIMVIYLYVKNESITSKWESDREFTKKFLEWFTPIKNWTLVVWIVSIIFAAFLPNTKEMLLIYGVGGTIDYIESNETVKQLPDKCIEALNKYLDDETQSR